MVSGMLEHLWIKRTLGIGTEEPIILVHFNQSVMLSTLSISSTTPPQAGVANVDDFSEIIYERQSDRNWASGFWAAALRRRFFDGIDGIYKIDCVDGGQD